MKCCVYNNDITNIWVHVTLFNILECANKASRENLRSSIGCFTEVRSALHRKQTHIYTSVSINLMLNSPMFIFNPFLIRPAAAAN